MNTHIKSGMSFIEIMIVILIMAMLLRVAAPNFKRWFGKGGRAATESSLRVLQNAIEEYQMDTGAYPQQLEDLVHQPEGLSGWEGPYLRQKTVPKDGWKQEFEYKRNEKGVQPPYELYSLGDQKSGSGPVYAD